MDGLKTIEQFIDQDSEIVCPSCGHFAGVYEICPRCGADVVKRTSLKVIKYSAVFLATVGLFFLYLWAKNRELPLVHPGDITATMNFARVRMEGIVVRKARVNYESGKVSSLTFRMCDGEIGNHKDTILVIAYRDIAESLVKRGLLPSQWDKVKLQGQIQVKKGEGMLLIQAPEHVVIEPAPAIPLKSATDGIVKIRVRVEKVEQPEKGSTKPMKITVTDGVDTRQVVVWSNVYKVLANTLRVGQIAEANVKVGKYRERIQFELRSPEDFQVIDPKDFTDADRVLKAGKQLKDKPVEKIIPDRRIVSPDEIDARFLNGIITVQGPIAKQYSFSKGVKLVLGNKGASVNVVLWPPLGETGLKFATGDIVKITGLVKQFNGNWELHPQSERDIVLQKAKTPEQPNLPENPAPKDDVPGPQPSNDTDSVLAPGQVNKKYLGKRVTVEGTLVREYTFSKGAKWLIAGDKGSIKALLWQKIRDKAAQKIDIGDKVRITGKVKEYKGRLEISPKGAYDIVLVEKKDYKRIASLHCDMLAKIKGKVTDRQLIPHGVRLEVEDRSGSIDVVLARDRFQRSILFYKLKADYRLKVKGQVISYQGRLQLQPESESDIEIIALPPKHQKKQVDEKKQIVVTAMSVNCRMIPPGVKLVITDVHGMPDKCQIAPSDRVDVILRSPSFADLDYLKSLGKGSSVEIKGQIDKYRDQYQLQISTRSDIKLLQQAPKDSAQKQPKQNERPKSERRIKHVTVWQEREDYAPVYDWQNLNARPLNAPLWVYGVLATNGDTWSLKLGEHAILLKLGALDSTALKQGKAKVKGVVIEENEKRVLAVFAVKFLEK